jgi:hypothetical protein
MRTVARSRARYVRVSFSAIRSRSSYFSERVMGRPRACPYDGTFAPRDQPNRERKGWAQTLRGLPLRKVADHGRRGLGGWLWALAGRPLPITIPGDGIVRDANDARDALHTLGNLLQVFGHGGRRVGLSKVAEVSTDGVGRVCRLVRQRVNRLAKRSQLLTMRAGAGLPVIPAPDSHEQSSSSSAVVGHESPVIIAPSLRLGQLLPRARRHRLRLPRC